MATSTIPIDALPDAEAIVRFQRQSLENPDWPDHAPAAHAEGLWKHVEENHRYNSLLWDQEDEVRRRDVQDAQVVASKRAIDRYNQQRNDAIERIDELILAALADVTVQEDAWINSETAGSIIDRLSILSLKVHNWTGQSQRDDLVANHADLAAQKLVQLNTQHADLAECLARLLQACQSGKACFRIYRQHKMYNDPRFINGLED